MRPRLALFALPALFLLMLGSLVNPSRSSATGESILPNVIWGFTDSISACPAGDSVYNAPVGSKRPSRLRISVTYRDENEEPRANVPPESLWVTYSTSSGDARINDKGTKIYADRATATNGTTRIQAPSLSGDGNLHITLFVSGVSQGTKTAHIRTTDSDASGRDSTGETSIDIDWSGSTTSADADTIASHRDHWRRNALHGALVKRTNLCEDVGCYGIGYSDISWSPSGRFIAHTQFVNFDCRVMVTRANEQDGLFSKKFTFASGHDYNPSWSPLDTVIVFDRDDVAVFRKGYGGATADTSESILTNVDSGDDCGDLMGRISPDGRWIAYAHCHFNAQNGGGRSIWKMSLASGTKKQLTPKDVNNTDFYPTWSPDGKWVVFQRSNNTSNQNFRMYRVSADSGAVVQLFVPSDTTYCAFQPAFSPDSLIMVGGYGYPQTGTPSVYAHTLDTRYAPLAVRQVIKNYGDIGIKALSPNFAILSPRVSPDGTRLAMTTTQLWAARHNMSIPPQINTITASCDQSTAVVDTTAVITIDVARGQANTIQLTAADTENDELFYDALLIDAGTMSFDKPTRTLTYTPPGNAVVGSALYVVFRVTTASGGTDAMVAALKIIATCPGSFRVNPELAGIEERRMVGPNPARGTVVFSTAVVEGARASVSIYDVTGREVITLSAPAGRTLVWNGSTDSGARAPSGIYLYRLNSGIERSEGKFVLMR